MSQVSVPRGRVTGLAAASFALLAALSSAQSGGPKIELLDGRGRAVASLQAGDTVTVQVEGLAPKTPYDLLLTTVSGEIVGFARSTASASGELGPEVLWYDSGITGPDPAGNGRPGQGFKRLAEAELYLSSHPLAVEVREQDVASPGAGKLVVSAAAPMQSPRTAPWLEFTDLQGRHRNAFEAGRDVMCVSGSGFPAGSAIKLFVTPTAPTGTTATPSRTAPDSTAGPIPTRCSSARPTPRSPSRSGRPSSSTQGAST